MYLYRSVPIELRFPSSINELRTMSAMLKLYTRTHPTCVLVLFCSAYIYKQTFAIPGSVFLVSQQDLLCNFALDTLLVVVGSRNARWWHRWSGYSKYIHLTRQKPRVQVWSSAGRWTIIRSLLALLCCTIIHHDDLYYLFWSNYSCKSEEIASLSG